jgi:LuxR family transcriptional regulator, maltose regulon positive regulatory protein
MSETTEQATSTAHRHIIERPRLTRLLDDASARVIMLVAPAGYGKTTLARQWLANRPHAWLQANEASSDVVALAVELARALSTLGLNTTRQLLERVRTMRDPRQELHALAQLQAEGLGSWPEDFWLAIDDYENIARSDFAEEYVRLLLEALGMRLLVASRVNPAWATARARLYGDIYAVDRPDLAMRVPETRAVLQDASESRVAQILMLADGWPALIGLASLIDLTAESEQDLPSTLFDYFADELFHRGSRALQVALPQLALAPRITKSLAASMFGPRKGPELLREAEDIGFFSATSSDLRLHPLLRRFLLTKLSGETRDAAADKLTQFFLAHSDWDAAFELVRLRQDGVALIQLCDVAYSSMLSNGRTSTLETWLQLASELGTASPVFDVIRAELALRDGNVSHAKRLALKAIDAGDTEYRSRAFTVAGRSAHLDNQESDALRLFQTAIACARTDEERYEASWGCLLSADAFEDDEDLLSVLDQFLARQPDGADDVLRASNARMMVAFATGEISETLEFALDVLAALDRAQDPLIRTSFLNNLSRALSLQARYVEAHSFADRLVADAQDANLDFVLPHAYVAEAVALIGGRRYAAAEEMLEHAERLAGEIGDRHNMLDARNVRAKLAITLRDYSRALSVLIGLHNGVSVTRTMMAELLATRGLAHASLGDVQEASASLSQAERLSSFPEIRSLIACSRAVMRLKQGCAPTQAAEELGVAFELSVLDPIVIVCRAFPELSTTVSVRRALAQPTLKDLLATNEPSNPATPAECLTRREREVLRLISVGYTNREIARELFIAEVTAKVHVRNIIRKLGVRSRTEAAIAAVRSETT